MLSYTCLTLWFWAFSLLSRLVFCCFDACFGCFSCIGYLGNLCNNRDEFGVRLGKRWSLNKKFPRATRPKLGGSKEDENQYFWPARNRYTLVTGGVWPMARSGISKHLGIHVHKGIFQTLYQGPPKVIGEIWNFKTPKFALFSHGLNMPRG